MFIALSSSGLNFFLAMFKLLEYCSPITTRRRWEREMSERSDWRYEGFAFPCEGGEENGGLIADPGVSVRQYFEAHVLAGLCANPAFQDNGANWLARRAREIARAACAPDQALEDREA